MILQHRTDASTTIESIDHPDLGYALCVLLRHSIDEATQAGFEHIVAELTVLSGVTSFLAYLDHDKLRRELENLGRDEQRVLVHVPCLLDAHLVLFGPRCEADVLSDFLKPGDDLGHRRCRHESHLLAWLLEQPGQVKAWRGRDDVECVQALGSAHVQLQGLDGGATSTFTFE